MAASQAGATQTQKLYIPVRQSDEFVELEELPKEVDDILDILMAEKAPLHIWLQVAREYYRNGQVEAFLRLLEEGANEEVEKELPEVRVYGCRCHKELNKASNVDSWHLSSCPESFKKPFF